MLLGIDVGGTHTDAVAVRIAQRKAELVAACKVRTRHDDLIASVNQALEGILKEVGQDRVRQLNLSTTLSTNAIVENRTEEVGVLLSGGPGIDTGHFMLCKEFHHLDGSIDHRGSEIRGLDQNQVKAAIDSCRAAGIKVFAAVSKFSIRNPVHERTIKRLVCSGRETTPCDGADFLVMGHELGGRLNFPRRVATAFFNCAVWRLYNAFADAVEQSLARLGLAGIKVNMLKADGGTSPFSLARRMPVQSIFSGPAASVMGILALCDISHDSVILDIGGTTTDIAVFAGGSPVVEQDGIDIGSHPTLVRALKVKSIGIGGDSAISMIGDMLRVGPNRLGPSFADAVDASPRPTLIDALNTLGIASFGDAAASRRGIAAFAARHNADPERLAKAAVDFAVTEIHAATRAHVAEINEKPVYTIHELLEGARIVPRKVYVMGGPAQAMRMELFRTFKLAVEVPKNHAVANAIGAALTRTTWDLELFADTEKNVLFIPSLGQRENIPATYTLAEAERDARNHLLAYVGKLGVVEDVDNVQITRASSFNMVSGDATVGKNIRVRCQIRPGVTRRLA